MTPKRDIRRPEQRKKFRPCNATRIFHGHGGLKRCHQHFGHKTPHSYR